MFIRENTERAGICPGPAPNHPHAKGLAGMAAPEQFGSRLLDPAVEHFQLMQEAGNTHLKAHEKPQLFDWDSALARLPSAMKRSTPTGRYPRGNACNVVRCNREWTVQFGGGLRYFPKIAGAASRRTGQSPSRNIARPYSLMPTGIAAPSGALIRTARAPLTGAPASVAQRT